MAYSITLDGEPIPVIVRKHPRSRRMVIRYQPRTQTLSLTLPRQVSLRQGLSFVEERRGWIAEQRRAHPALPALADGSVLTILGRDYVLRSQSGRGVARLEGGEFIVPGDPQFLKRRVQDFLKALARREITAQAWAQAARLGKKIRRIGLRDTTSHWGSCNAAAHLSFSWRLVLAPREVLEYVVCHEVAHLVHLNHSPAFWKTVEALCPGHAEARRWLKTHGARLHGLL